MILIKFLFKRVFLFSVILAVVAFFIFERSPLIPTGIIIGGLISVYKIRLYTVFLSYFIQNKNRTFSKSLFLNLFSQVLSLTVLVVAVKYNTSFFFSIAAGLLITAAVICVNGVTEKLGITHNKWGEV